ncbi:aryl-sulfate sulfotransferase [Hahella sp. CCB-MM4]|uniref:ribbon-helix-helix domain-containing protein n=1 Tax=Hahella sp. (strain CCB-MM4) TaxID=1926491 RepID=UPI000B9A92BA|nr:ribbon-helix-helix domain-containing protein [Hahella sp. CCB-MM4]OZG73246.1 aryl-sulfate sulfotransferase [Hahella sp. CCB-MM4]
MCDVYAGVDTSAYTKASRSLRLHGHVTSLSLEIRFWDILELMANKENVSVATFITTLHDEVVQRYGEARNFTSLLRVACTTYLMNEANQSDVTTSVDNLKQTEFV